MAAMTEQEWLGCEDPRSMLEFLNRGSSRRKFGLLASACCRTVFDWLIDHRSREAIDVVEAFADGLKGERDLERASARARRADEMGLGPPASAVHWATLLNIDNPDSIGCLHVIDDVALSFGERGSAEWTEARAHQAQLLRCIFGNPFRPVSVDPAWLTSTVVALAEGIYADRAFDRLPILADALEDAGCDHADILAHCRGDGPHARGCWVVDILLGKE